MADLPTPRDPMERLDRPPREVLALMENIHIVADLTLRERSTLAEIAEVVRCPGGEVVYQAGEPGRHLYCVLKGRMELRATTAPGITFTVREVAPGQTAGIDAVLNQTLHPIACYAAENLAALRFSTARLHQLLALGNPAVIKLFAALRAEMGAQVREATQHFVKLLSEASRHSGAGMPASSSGLASSSIQTMAIPAGNPSRRG